MENTTYFNQELLDKALQDLNQTKKNIENSEIVEGWSILRHRGYDENDPINKQMHKTSLIQVPDEPIYIEFKNKWGNLVKGYIYQFRIDYQLKTCKAGWKMYRVAVIRHTKEDSNEVDFCGTQMGIDKTKLPSKLKPKSPKFIQEFNKSKW